MTVRKYQGMTEFEEYLLPTEFEEYLLPTEFEEYLIPILLHFSPVCFLLNRNKAGNIHTNVKFRGVSVTTVAEQKQ
jgi:hypothetical protein